MICRIVSIRTATPTLLQHSETQVLSGIAKNHIYGSVYCGLTGLEGDFHGDQLNHGHPDKALLLYPYSHYMRWEKDLGHKLPIGILGENLILQNFDERKVRIGDVFSNGETVLQISQPRFPCWKLAAYTDIPQLNAHFDNSARFGVYARILNAGLLDYTRPLRCIRRGLKGNTVSAAYQCRIDPKKHQVQIQKFLSDPLLSTEWKNILSSEETL